MTPPYRIEITAAVRRQIDEIHDYIAGEGAPIAADRMVERIVEVVNSLAELPMRGRPAGASHRELIVWPYLIRYRISRDAIYITRIRHGARRPD